MMRVAIIGRTHWLVDTAYRLMEAGHEIVLVITAQPSPEYKASIEDFRRLAVQSGAPFLSDIDINEPTVVSTLQAAQADVGVSINWPVVIRKEACNALPFGILNAHAGDLPRYRGNACPNWAILNGEQYVGLCVHQMDPVALDAGPLWARNHFSITSGEDIGDVYRWMDQTIPQLYKEALERLRRDSAVPQDIAAVTPLRCFPRRPSDAHIDWKLGSTNILRLIRASSRPFAGAFTFLEGIQRVRIWRACEYRFDHDVLAVPGQIGGRGRNGGVIVCCGTGAIEILDVDIDGRESLPASNRFRLGPLNR